MNRTRTYQSIAIINIVCGGLLLLGDVASGFSPFLNADSKYKLIFTAMLLFIAVIGLSLILSAVRHLKIPSRKSSLTLASNSSVIIWFLVGGLLSATKLKDLMGPAYVGVALGIAFLSYRLYLKPAALLAFPEEEKESDPAGTDNDGTALRRV